MMRTRYDETWHRLREWTKGQTPSERLAAQILINQGFTDIDPSHPLGGKDGGKDAIAVKDGKRFAMAVYFPRGQQTEKEIRTKFRADLTAARPNSVAGIAFVTNQEFTLGEREIIRNMAAPTEVELFHLERITTILDSPGMAAVREQFLDISAGSALSIDLGGKGGKAPGAGGGGGGAIGSGARAGRGGNGGNVYNLTPDQIVNRVLEEMFQMPSGYTGSPPGAGGGGAGVQGANAIAGNGGDGGDMAAAVIEVVPGDIFQVEVGKGGKTGVLPGQHGGDGGDSIIRISSPDGILKREIIVKGGKGARCGNLPDGVSEISLNDLKGDFFVSTLMLVDAAELRCGVISMLGGGWLHYRVPEMPFNTVWKYICSTNWRKIEGSIARGIQLCVIDPHGAEVSRIALVIPGEHLNSGNYNFSGGIGAPLNSEGRWIVRVQSGEFLFSEVGVNVVLAH